MLRAMDLGITDRCECTSREQTSQIAIALFTDAAKFVLPPARILLRHEADPGREVSSRSEGLRISNARNQSRGQGRADAGDLVETPARLMRPMPSRDAAIELQNLCL